MYEILSVAIAVTLATSVFICIRWRNLECTGPTPLPLLAFSAILFTSGLDVGLIMFPLVEFPVYASEEQYSFTNPLAIEFGFWGFLVWGVLVEKEGIRDESEVLKLRKCVWCFWGRLP